MNQSCRRTLALLGTAAARFAAALLSVVIISTAAYAQGQAVTQRIGGDVVGVDGARLQMKTRAGESVAVTLAPAVNVSARSRADLSNIAPGAFVGTTATEQADGTLKASEVHVFPESMRGTGEGHRPYAPVPGSTMTNATVAAVGRQSAAATSSTMTNATVSTLSNSAGIRTMKLTYKGGEKVVVIPADTPIVAIEPGDRSLLIPGAHIVVSAVRQSDGSLLADRITVGKGGFVPPI